MTKLKRLRLAGWKSIKDQTIDLGSVTVLVGANGAGKSNLVSFFQLLNETFAKSAGFRRYVATHGGAASLLHYGPKATPKLECELQFEATNGKSLYRARWEFGQDELVFLDETIGFHSPQHEEPLLQSLGAGHTESRLAEKSKAGDKSANTAKVLLAMLRGCRMFHFHDTSETAGIRRPAFVHQYTFLLPDASNLPAMLYRFQEHNQREYSRIREAVRQMVPGFEDFVLEPDPLDNKRVELRWVGEGSAHEFNAFQLSDGSLRFMALATLLLQPTATLPSLIVLDEPELGLHPAALRMLGEMVRETSSTCQVLLATQSPLLLDEFEAAEVVVTENQQNVTTFRRLSDEAAMDHWIQEYTLSELWERNFVGGGPY